MFLPVFSNTEPVKYIDLITGIVNVEEITNLTRLSIQIDKWCLYSETAYDEFNEIADINGNSCWIKEVSALDVNLFRSVLNVSSLKFELYIGIIVDYTDG
jgi:hypothetical protein